jgi:hypothetical protein
MGPPWIVQTWEYSQQPHGACQVIAGLSSHLQEKEKCAVTRPVGLRIEENELTNGDESCKQFAALP